MKKELKLFFFPSIQTVPGYKQKAFIYLMMFGSKSNHKKINFKVSK